jgi:hypothetical protein
LLQGLYLLDPVDDFRTAFPIGDALDAAIALVEWVPVGQAVELLFGFFDFAEGDINPDVLEDIGALAEEPVNILEVESLFLRIDASQDAWIIWFMEYRS